MITIVNTPFGYYTYKIDNLWTDLSQMGWTTYGEQAS